MRTTISKTTMRALLFCFSLMAFSGFLSQTRAATLYWDANGAGAGTGGTGPWNNSDITWRDGSAVGTLQAWADGSRAILGGTAGTLTLAGPITVSPAGTSGAITSTTDGYIINGASTLTFLDPDGDNFLVAVSDGANTRTINTPVQFNNINAATPMAFWFRDSTILNGSISDGGVAHTLEVVDNSTVTLNNANSLTGTVRAYSGSTIVVGHNSALGSANLSWSSGMILQAGGGDRTLGGNHNFGGWNWTHTMSGANDIRFTGNIDIASGAFSARSTMNVTGTGDLIFDGTVTLNAGQAGGLIKTGSGTLVVNGFNNGNNTQGVDVNAGTLLVNGAYQAVITTVASDATLGGTGTITGDVTVNAGATNGILAPGTSVGTLTVNGDVNLEGTLATEFLGATSDLLAVTGNLTLGLGSTLDLLGTLELNMPYTIASYTGTLSGTFNSINSTGLYLIDYGTGLNSQITIQAIPVPEPGSFLLIGLGAIGLLRSVRRRNSKA